jgi:hypothetical protein
VGNSPTLLLNTSVKGLLLIQSNNPDKYSTPHNSVIEKPNKVIAIQFVNLHNLLNIEYFFKILIINAIRVNFNIQPLKLVKKLIIIVIKESLSLLLFGLILFNLLINSAFVNLFKFFIYLF